MSVERNPETKRVTFGIIVLFTAIGLFSGGQAADLGIVVTWFWMGIGLAVVYLLYRLVVTMERILGTI